MRVREGIKRKKQGGTSSVRIPAKFLQALGFDPKKVDPAEVLMWEWDQDKDGRGCIRLVNPDLATSKEQVVA